MTAESTRPEATKSLEKKQQQRNKSKRRRRRSRKQHLGEEEEEEEEEDNEDNPNGRVEMEMASNAVKEVLPRRRRRDDWRRETFSTVPSWWSQSRRKRKILEEAAEEIKEEEEEEDLDVEVQEATGQVSLKSLHHHHHHHNEVGRRKSEGANRSKTSWAWKDSNEQDQDAMARRRNFHRSSIRVRRRRRSGQVADENHQESLETSNQVNDKNALPCSVEFQGDSFQPLDMDKDDSRLEEVQVVGSGSASSSWGDWLIPKMLRKKSGKVASSFSESRINNNAGERNSMEMSTIQLPMSSSQHSQLTLPPPQSDNNMANMLISPSTSIMRKESEGLMEVLRETRELERILRVAEAEDSNWIEASVSLASDDGDPFEYGARFRANSPPSPPNNVLVRTQAEVHMPQHHHHHTVPDILQDIRHHHHNHNHNHHSHQAPSSTLARENNQLPSPPEHKNKHHDHHQQEDSISVIGSTNSCDNNNCCSPTLSLPGRNNNISDNIDKRRGSFRLHTSSLPFADDLILNNEDEGIFFKTPPPPPVANQNKSERTRSKRRFMLKRLSSSRTFSSGNSPTPSLIRAFRDDVSKSPASRSALSITSSILGAEREQVRVRLHYVTKTCNISRMTV